MNFFIFALLAASIGIALASDYYAYGHGKHGTDHYGQDHDQSYKSGFTKGYDKGGYGDYGSKKYGGWKEYAKGKEHASYYGSEYDDSKDYGHNHYDGGMHGHHHGHHGHHGHYGPDDHHYGHDFGHYGGLYGYDHY